MGYSITLKYRVITAVYGDEEEYEDHEFETEYNEEDIILCYGFEDTPNNRKVIAEMLSNELFRVEEDKYLTKKDLT